MKKIIFLMFVLMNFSCNSKTQIRNVRFDNVNVSIPNTVSEIKQRINLQYQVYRGFRGESNNYEVLIHLENYPIWVNSENVNEDFYANKRVVGITFIKQCNNIEEQLKILSKQLSVVFKKDNSNDYYLASGELTILTFTKKGKCYVSFYNGVNSNEIKDYYLGTW